MESISHLLEIPSESLDTSEEYDYTEDVDYLRTYGRA
jgi:hypothetical protein